MIYHMLFTGWNFMRWLRLGFGVFIAVQALQYHDPFAGFIAVFFLLQAITNTGCCGAGGCAVPVSKSSGNRTENVEFEEVK